MTVAIIAIDRKVIILEVKDLSGLALVEIAAIILTLSIGYYLIKKKNVVVTYTASRMFNLFTLKPVFWERHFRVTMA